MKYFKESNLFINKGEYINCIACQRKCLIPINSKGFCGVRLNIGGKLFVPYGYVSSLNKDPIEKKPLYHFLPGSMTLSFGMLGCNFKCLYCQNWEISQINDIEVNNSFLRSITVEDFYDLMKLNKIHIAVSTYNEPTVSIEWAYAIFSYLKNRDAKIKTGFVSNGYISNEAFDFILPVLDFIKIDIKSFEPQKFKRLTSADLNNLIQSIKYIASKKIHIEFVNLVVEGFNDDISEFSNMIDFILTISPYIPLHLTAFHPDYKMMARKRTSPSTIEKMIKFAISKGLKFVYGGNYLTNYSDTLCPYCKRKIIRRGYMSLESNEILIKNFKGLCPYCENEIYGIWE